MQSGRYRMKKVPLQDIKDKDRSTKKKASKQEGREHADNEYSFNFHITGNHAVGKTCLLLRFVDNTYSESSNLSIPEDFKTKTIKIDGRHVTINASEPSRSRYRRSHAAIVVYDVTDLQSFKRVKDWIRDYRCETRDSTKIIVVGNKLDRANRERAVSFEDAKAYCQDPQNGIDGFIEASAKNNQNVEDVFALAAKAVMGRLNPKRTETNPKLNDEGLLMHQLNQYTQKIESHEDPFRLGNPDFSHGFLFFASSRAINREANYYLAIKLHKNLAEGNKSITDTFKDLTNQRNRIIGKHDLDKRPDFSNRGIRSGTLNGIISTVRRITHNENDESRPFLTKP